MVRVCEGALTRDDLDEVRAAVPDVGAVVDDDDHIRVARKEALQTLARHTCSRDGGSASRVRRAIELCPPSPQRLTATLVPTKDPAAKQAAVGVDHLADFDRVRARAHCVHVHLVHFRDALQEIGQAGTARRGRQRRSEPRQHEWGCKTQGLTAS